MRRFDLRASSLVAMIVASACLLLGADARAQPSPSEVKLVNDMLRDAIHEERAGHCDDAISLMKQAMAIKETADLMLHLGECQAKVGTFLEALKTWEKGEQIARAEKDASLQGELAKKQLALRERLPTVVLRVPNEARGVAVKVDDKALPSDKGEAPIQLDPGDHAIAVTAEGRKPFSTTVSLAERDSKAIAVSLPLVDPPLATAPADAAQPSSRVPAMTWIAGGVAVGLVIGGFVTFAVAGGDASSGRTACAQATACDASDVSAVHTLDRVALAMWIGGGVAAGVSIGAFVLHRSDAKTPAATARLLAGPRSLALVGSF